MPEPVGGVCPYCKQILDKRPKRKKRCPHCREYIYVRSSPSGNGSKVLVTEDGAEQIDLEWRRVRSRRRWRQSLGRYGVTDGDFELHRERLRTRFGQVSSDGDVVWSLFQDALERCMKCGNVLELGTLYFDMARFLYDEERDFSIPLQQYQRMELLYYKQKGFTGKLQIHVRYSCCETCRRLEGQTYTLDEAMEQMPIPCKECTFALHGGRPGWCRCQYTVAG
jgi:hypothetical protein